MKNKKVIGALASFIIGTNMVYGVSNEFIKHKVIEDTKTIVLRVGEYPNKPGKRTTPSSDVISRLDSSKYPLNPDGTLSEYYINKEIALSIQKGLHKRGVEVILQDTKGAAEDLNNAGNIAKKHNPDLYFSVHTNAADNKDVSGFYFLTSSASQVHNSKVEDISKYIGDRNSINKRHNEYATNYIGELNVVTGNNLSMLCEYGFFTNNEDLLLLTDKGYVEEIGDITARAIINTLEIEN